jgi:leucyl aminopeptidase
MAIMSYKGNPQSEKAIGLLGKGVTFDTGGISIKGAQGMEEMKGDMSGGAAVIAATWALAKLRAPVNATAIVPMTENMPSGSATKPGDVVRAMNGKTIEIINTDAEGRLILADALAYARKLGLSPLVDVATLTGAMIVALGKSATGVIGNDQPLVDGVLRAGEATGERMWHMPLFKDYREKLRSDVADIKNTGPRDGGAINAAVFLSEFVEDTPWVHLDMAPADFVDRDKGAWVKGATGIPVRTLVRLTVDLG